VKIDFELIGRSISVENPFCVVISNGSGSEFAFRVPGFSFDTEFSIDGPLRRSIAASVPDISDGTGMRP